MTCEGLHIEVRGTVQGVGYRPWVFQLAQSMDIRGVVWNHSRGVSIDAFGTRDALERFVSALQGDAPPAARVRSVTSESIPFADHSSFAMIESVASAERLVSIPVDLSTCDDCLREMLDPSDRRYRYPFINCTKCGPRYSIVRETPYDRSNTSMAPFRLCEACRGEYESPDDRRSHAQPIACHDCGPRLVARRNGHQEIVTGDVVRFAARSLHATLTVAIKGLGGFHLACDATSAQAVQRLRDRKRRERRPLAVMVYDLEAAERVAELSDTERALLTSIERPIVLARTRAGSPIAPQVSGDIPLTGIFLPYTPLHHLLLRDAGVPLVMTSGNLSDEPMVTTNPEALEQLRDVADVFLTHDREIVTRVDDSVAQVIDGAPALIRRARGYVPRAIETARPFVEPVLGCGAHLKNTFCIGAGSSAFLGPHIGDLESVATLRAYETSIERLKTFVGASPTLLAHDLHPEYFSTRYALAQVGMRTVGVQHHHAHVVSAMAEHGLAGPAIGIAYDGTGFGTDGTAWGGEILLTHYENFERVATFRPIPLAGGDQAIRQPWRIALALLDDTFAGDPPLDLIPLFSQLPPQAIEAVRRMIKRGFNTTPARGVGRWFDALGALILGIGEAHYEGEVAFRWNMAADPAEKGLYPVVIHDGVSPWEIDPRSMVRAAIADLLAGRSAGMISARFHNTIAAMTAEVTRAALAIHGELPVVMSGGCFQNVRLAESVIAGIRPTTRVFLNREVPAGDGGIALGQAFVADARLRAGYPVTVHEEETVCV